MIERVRSEIEKKIDIIEDDIANISPVILEILIKDRTTGNNIMWCTKDYESFGPEYEEHQQLQVNLITGERFNVIQPRAAKSEAIQEARIKNRAEVFTPSWVCNEQNNQIDDAWFNRKNVFNTPQGVVWKTTKRKIGFKSSKRTWEDYVKSKRLEVTCGEAPYLVSRYDTTTGDLVPLNCRIGMFDRKMRIVFEHCEDDESWLEWSIKALQNVYGYEYQGDSVLIARENLLYDYIDYYKGRFNKSPSVKLLKNVANIISWNIWQMDGLKGVVPYSCHDDIQEDPQMSVFIKPKGPKVVPCPGCKQNDMFAHNGIYCRIIDWENPKKKLLFVDSFKGDA